MMSGDVNPRDWIPTRRSMGTMPVTAFLSNVSLLLIITCRTGRSIEAPYFRQNLKPLCETYYLRISICQYIT
jgi:hypothetical protein